MIDGENGLIPGIYSRIRPMIELLERVQALAKENFPKARDFVRPGFDEIETVM